jgi:hypothetical protein
MCTCQITGTIDVSSESITVGVSVIGISLGTVRGSLKTGVTVKVNLLLEKGEVDFFLQNKALWVKITLKGVKDYSGSHELIKL